MELGRFLSILITEMPNLKDKTRYLCSLFESSVNSRMTFRYKCDNMEMRLQELMGVLSSWFINIINVISIIYIRI